jgi:hypothetical protein
MVTATGRWEVLNRYGLVNAILSPMRKGRSQEPGHWTTGYEGGRVVYLVLGSWRIDVLQRGAGLSVHDRS